MPKAIIHVAQDAIVKNRKQGTNDPAVIVRSGSRSARHHQVQLHAPDGTLIGTFRYQPHKPLPCGARLWLELEDGVTTTPVDHNIEQQDYYTSLSWETERGGVSWWSGTVRADSPTQAVQTAWAKIQSDKRRHARRLIEGKAQ